MNIEFEFKFEIKLTIWKLNCKTLDVKNDFTISSGVNFD